MSPLRGLLLLFALLATVFARTQHASRASFEPLRLDFLAVKRDASSYGWNDCEFSPLSCLLRKRRAAENSESASTSDLSFATCSYSIAVRTSAVEKAETKGHVFVQLIDTNGRTTDRVKLKCSNTHRKKYQRGHSDLFLLVDQAVLGPLKAITVTHVKRTSHESLKTWHLHSILVINHERNELYRFDAHKWLGDNGEKTHTTTLDVVGQPSSVMPPDAEQLFG